MQDHKTSQGRPGRRLARAGLIAAQWLLPALAWAAPGAPPPPPPEFAGPSPLPMPADGKLSAELVQGAYVARAADCMSCHTEPGGKPFAGGDKLKTVFGDIYGPNITPDPKTGIGTWTLKDFDRALRQGINKAGEPLYPAMPYIDYAKMSDADLAALWAYIHSVPAVAHQVPPPEKTFQFPFNVRQGVWAWRAIYFKPGHWEPATDKSYAWNRGAYLVTVLEHCGECHTPKNLAMAPKDSYTLTGGQLEGWYAPDISTDPMSSIAKDDVNEVATFLRTGRLPGNSVAIGPMQEAIHDSLRYLSSDDLLAIATYVKDAPKAEQKRISPTTVSSAQLADGKQLYLDNCSSCHGTNGQGTGRQIPSLDGNSVVTAEQPNDVVMAMLQGFAPSGSRGAMGSFAKQLNDAQIADIANYVRTAWSNHANPDAEEWQVGDLRMMADIPAKSRQPALICPLVGADVMRPALKEDPALLRKAATDRDALEKVVRDYTAARPRSSAAEAVEALSSAYCRAIVSEKVPMGQSGARVALFTQKVAIALSHARGPAPTASNIAPPDRPASSNTAAPDRPAASK